ncbi:MAG: VWA domain-containing protein [Polyangiales bacterium]
MKRIAFLCALLAACDCSSAPPRPAGLCTDEAPPAECGERCSLTRACPFGFFCNAEAECDVECVDDTVCDIGYECGDNGRCTVMPLPFDAVGHDGPLPDRATCAQQEVAAGRTTPHVIIVVDQSGSMDEDFGDSNRWDALRDSLLAEPDGFIYALQEEVIFGLALFSGDEAMCPILTTVPSALNNHAAIAEVYNEEEIRSETPTGDSMDQLLDELLSAPDRNDNPTIFILATDGEPDTCEEPNPQNGQAEALAAVRRAYENDIRTYVISVGTDISEAHLTDMANAGLGRSGGPDAEFWVAGDDVGLRDALGEIIGGALSCTIELEGRIDVAEACTGRVELNGNPLVCDDPDGWVVIDESHIELQGEACERLTMNSNSTLRATFPCGVLVI